MLFRPLGTAATRANRRRALPLLIAIVSIGTFSGSVLRAQAPQPPLSLDSAIARSVRGHPSLTASRAEVAAAEAAMRQAGALPNPTLSWRYERTSASGNTNSQHITTLEQPLGVGTRSARRDAAAAWRDVSVAAHDAATQDVALATARAYAAAAEAERRAAIAQRASEAFARARRIVDERYAAGDASGYEQRRVQLEAARYDAVRAARDIARRRAWRELATLIGADAGSQWTLTLPDGAPPMAIESDSALLADLAGRPDARRAEAAVRAAEADARFASWSRVPAPTLVGGLKSEDAAGLGTLRGIAAGVSIPLPLFDRRTGARDAAVAGADRARAQQLDVQRVGREELLAAADAVRAADAQIAALRPVLGESADRALAAANAAFAEGDIPLDAWLSALRAYDEAEDAYATLLAEALVRRAELARARGQLTVR